MIPVFAPTLVPGGAPVADDAATTAWVAAVVSAGGSVSGGRKTVVNNLIIGLKADGIWTKLDRLWLYAAENSQSALIDIVNLGAATAVNSPTFTTDRGYTGDGSSQLIDSNFNLASTSGVFSRNSACLFAWSNTANSDGGAITGATNPANAIFPSYGGTIFYGSLNSTASLSISNSNQTGLFSLSRESSSSIVAYRNGSVLGSGTDTSTASGSTAFTFLSSEYIGNYSSRQVPCGGFGASLTATEQGNLYTRLRTYMTAVGVP